MAWTYIIELGYLLHGGSFPCVTGQSQGVPEGEYTIMPNLGLMDADGGRLFCLDETEAPGVIALPTSILERIAQSPDRTLVVQHG